MEYGNTTLCHIKKKFDDVAKYFSMYKWMNFLDENILKDVICWTNLDR
jgi:hypothetical protein